MHYRITVCGRVKARVEPIFPDLAIEASDEVSILSGPVKDQAQLHGIIALIRDLNAPLVAVERIP